MKVKTRDMKGIPEDLEYSCSGGGSRGGKGRRGYVWGYNFSIILHKEKINCNRATNRRKEKKEAYICVHTGSPFIFPISPSIPL